MSDAVAQIAPRHLTFDEVEDWSGDKYRIRVWQGKFVCPVILVSQIAHGAHPRLDIVPIANYVHSAILKFPELGVSVFMDGLAGSQGDPAAHGDFRRKSTKDDQRPKGAPRRVLEYVMFEVWGCPHRLRLFNPAPVPRDWRFLQDLVGENLER